MPLVERRVALPNDGITSRRAKKWNVSSAKIAKEYIIEELNECIDRALAVRTSLIADPALDAYRLFNGQADGVAGLVIDRLADVLIVQFHEGRFAGTVEDVRPAVERLRATLGLRSAYRKMFVRDRARASSEVTAGHRDAVPWIGDPVDPELTIRENGLRFIVRPYDGFSVGLFLEHRDNRRRVRELARRRRVLNGFCYTCGFSVAAAVGEAAFVASVDLSKRYLEWSKQNFAANDLDPADHQFFCCDVLNYYARAKRQGRQFDLIVLDPPTFSRIGRSKQTFVLADQMMPLVSGTVGLLATGGIVLFSLNTRTISASEMEGVLRATGQPRCCTIIDRPALPVDFAGDPGYSKTIIARFE